MGDLMGKGSGKAKVPKDTAFDKSMKEQGPAMSDPVGPILQLTQLGGFPGMIDWNATSLGAQMEGLPPEMLQQIRAAGEPRPVPTAPVQTPVAKTSAPRSTVVPGWTTRRQWGM